MIVGCKAGAGDCAAAAKVGMSEGAADSGDKARGETIAGVPRPMTAGEPRDGVKTGVTRTVWA